MGPMEKLIASHDRGFVRVLVARLRDEGIEHLVKDESASSMGEVTPIVASQHVWIVNEVDQNKAQEILTMLQEASMPQEGGNWTCRGCGEALEPQFTECWQCGTERPA